MDEAVDGTLDLIDGALRDWETSADAMRWTPDKAVITGDGYTCGGMQGMTPSLVIYDEIAGFGAVIQRQMDAVATALNASLRSVLPDGMRFEWVSSTPDDPGREEPEAWTAPRTGWYSLVRQPDMRAGHRIHAIYWPRHHIRCHDCHPIANPQPLVINGAQYRRRQKARRRR